jgi:hypothetical protein
VSSPPRIRAHAGIGLGPSQLDRRALARTVVAIVEPAGTIFVNAIR